jgi:hypothetical protein
MQVIASNARTGAKCPEDWFTGMVCLDEMAVGVRASNLRAHSVTFSPGSRTARHAQPPGWALHVLSGVGGFKDGASLYANFGQETACESTRANGTGTARARNRVFIRLAVQEAAVESKEACWFERVAAEECNAGPQVVRAGKAR